MKTTVQIETEDEGMRQVTTRTDETSADALISALLAHAGRLDVDPLMILAQAVDGISGDPEDSVETDFIKAADTYLKRMTGKDDAEQPNSMRLS